MTSGGKEYDAEHESEPETRRDPGGESDQGPPPREAEDATVVEAARALGEVGREILEPVGSILGDQATRVERLRSFVRDLDSTYLKALLAIDGIGALALAATVILAGLYDAYMFVLMEILLGIFLLRYIRASVDGLRWRRWLRGLATGLLSGVWAVMLFDRIPAEPLWGAEVLKWRDPLPALWAPVIAHGIVALGVLVHLPLKRHLHPRWRG